MVRLPAADAEPFRRLMQTHQALGCLPSSTCAPYQSFGRPCFGDQVTWGKSNAIVLANAVIGARAARYGDFIDVCCAIAGRVPAWSLHLDEHRFGQAVFRLTSFPDSDEFATVGDIGFQFD